MGSPRTRKTRIIIKRTRSIFSDVAPAVWDRLGGDFGDKRVALMKDQLITANRCYVRAQQKLNHSLTSDATIKAIERWINASGRLRKDFGYRPTSVRARSRKSVLKTLTSASHIEKLQLASPIGFGMRMLRHAMAVLLAARNNPSLQIRSENSAELWMLWARMVAIAAQSAKIATSASSHGDSDFCSLVMILQKALPEGCKRFSKRKSLAKGLQKSKKDYGHLDASECVEKLKSASRTR